MLISVINISKLNDTLNQTFQVTSFQKALLKGFVKYFFFTKSPFSRILLNISKRLSTVLSIFGNNLNAIHVFHRIYSDLNSLHFQKRGSIFEMSALSTKVFSTRENSSLNRPAETTSKNRKSNIVYLHINDCEAACI